MDFYNILENKEKIICKDNNSIIKRNENINKQIDTFKIRKY